MKVPLAYSSRFSFLGKAFAYFLLAISLICFLSAAASAATLNGSVKNGTTGKPSAGDDVVLIKLAQGMEEAARTKTDANGKFTLTVEDDGQPHLRRR